METKLYNLEGKAVGKYDLPERVFNVEMNGDVLHRVAVAHLANQRKPLAHTKTRGEVRGGGIKPWRQKGTGRARHGSIRSPIWIGGGVTFGPRKDRNYKTKINKKEKQKALFMALSSKVRDAELALVDDLSLSGSKTKLVLEMLKAFSSSVFKSERMKKTLIVTAGKNENLALAARNLPSATVARADSLNVYDILNHKFLIMPKEAVSMIDKTYNKPK